MKAIKQSMIGTLTIETKKNKYFIDYRDETEETSAGFNVRTNRGFSYFEQSGGGVFATIEKAFSFIKLYDKSNA